MAAEAPHDYAVATWLTDEGLPHNVVNRIRQDASGYLWLGTAAGLSRFDGFEFESFPPPAEFTKGGYSIRDLAVVDGNTLLFLPPLGGVVEYRDGVFRQHPISEHIQGKIAELYTEPDGTIWAGTFEGALTRWDHGQVETFGPAAGIVRRGLGFYFARDRLGHTWIAAGNYLGFYANGSLVKFPEPLGAMVQVAAARDGGLWVISDGSLLKVDETGVHQMPVDPPWLALKTSVRCFWEDDVGTLWLGTARHGLFRYRNGSIEGSAVFQHQGIQSILEDHEGNIWVATDGAGIGRLRAKAFHIFDHDAGLTESMSTSVCEDETGDVWFANRAGGLARKRGNDVQVFPYNDGKYPIFVSAICPDRKGHLWVSATIGIYQISLRDPSVLKKVDTPMRNARVLFRSREGDIWAGTAGDLLGYFRDGKLVPITAEQGFRGEGVTTIAQDGAGDMWCGCSTGELYRWHDGKMTRFDEKDGLPASPIHALLPEPSGGLWIGSLSGLWLHDSSGFHRFGSAQGLPDGMVLQIEPDNRGRLWIGGSGGLIHVNHDELLAVAAGRIERVHVGTHGKDEGLAGISPTTDYQPSTWKDSHGNLWFTTYRGVLELDPQAVIPNTKPPPVLIKQALVDERPLNPNVPADIGPGPHQFVFSFAALSYAAPAKVRMRHRLEGVDPHWVETTEARTARYSNLPPGSYRLRVIACNDDGIWNDAGATFTFRVQPAWWQTRWFLAGGFAAFTAAIVIGVRFWTQRRLRRRLELLEREHALEKERARIARDLHDELGASITGIGMVVNRLRESAHEEVKPAVEQLTGRTRRLASDLERVVWTVSPKNNSLDRLAGFIGRYAQNFFRDSGVVCLVRGQRDIPALTVAPDVQHHVLAVAKEAINNALKHAKASQVIVECSYANGWFTLAIRDNGIGFRPASMEHSERNGLSNMQTRIAEIGGRICLDSTPGQGCSVVFEVPIRPQFSPN